MKRVNKTGKAGRPLALLLALILLLTTAVGGTLAYIVTQTPSLVNLFAPFLDPTEDVILRKTVEHPFGGDYVTPDGLEFTFQVALGEGYAGESLSTTDGSKTADEQGVLTLSVPAGGSAAVYDVKVGTEVTVTELAPGTGFEAKKDTQTLTVTKDTENALEFVNVYAPKEADSGLLTVTGLKTLEGRDWQLGDSFTFALEQQEKGKWNTVGTETVTYEQIEVEDPDDPGKTIWIDKPDYDRFDMTALLQSIRFHEAGVYSFRISEQEGSIGGITYDETVCYFDVTVGDADMDGSLEIQSVTGDNNTVVTQDQSKFHVDVTICNRYAPTGSAQAEIQITKTVKDSSGGNKTPAGFVFELYDEEGSLIARSEPTSASGETAIKLIYPPEDAGKLFTYTLKEQNAGKTIDGMTYDDTEYQLQVLVADNYDGTVSAIIRDDVEEQPEETEEALLEEPAPEEEAAEKVPEPEETEPEPVSEEAAQLEQSAPAEETVPDEPEAILSEPADAEAETEQETEPETEPVTSSPTPPQKRSNVYQAAFENRYDPKDAKTTLEGVKMLEGRSLKAGEFSFVLYETEAGFAVSDSAKPAATAKNDSTGAFRFSNLTFDKVGTYYYAVMEDDSHKLGGVTYDDAKYLITVTVTDKGGSLTAETVITDAVGNEAELSFTNYYQASFGTVVLEGEKVLTGAALEENAFTFDLYTADEDFQKVGIPIQSVTNDADGAFAFDALTFETEGEWYYVVKENGTAPLGGMVYDETEYHVTITVRDNGEGELVPDLALTNAGEHAQTLRFENRYVPNAATLTLTGEKTLKGASLTEGMFTFCLYEADQSFTAQGDAIRTAVNGADGAFTFDALTYTEAGTYYYLVQEDSSKALERITYDDTAYGVTVTVTDDGTGALTAEKSIVKVGGTAVDAIRFVNTYVPAAGDAAVTITAKKTVKSTGTDTISPEGFTFVLENTVTGAKTSAKSDKNGLAVFALTFTEADAGKTYSYRLTETNDGQSGVTYSTQVYDFQITVTLGEDHTLTATVTYHGAVVDDFAAEFVNTYEKPNEAGTSGDTTEDSTGSGSETPKTGDSSHILGYAILLAVSVTAIAVLILRRRRIK